MKTCGKCASSKPREEFGPLMASKDGLSYLCRPCLAKKQAERRARYPAEARLALRRAYRKNKTDDPLYRKRATLRHHYGISYEQFAAQAAEQNGLCAICGVEDGNLFVDHCHKSGSLRGLLCSTCNAGIGMLRDDPTIILKAAEYVENKGTWKK